MPLGRVNARRWNYHPKPLKPPHVDLHEGAMNWPQRVGIVSMIRVPHSGNRGVERVHGHLPCGSRGGLNAAGRPGCARSSGATLAAHVNLTYFA